MSENPYERFMCEELILRDELAVDRTLLANERTLMAYLRSALTLFIAGVTFIHFFEYGALFYLGVAFIPCAAATTLFGIIRHRKMSRAIYAIRNKFGNAPKTERAQVL